MTKAQNHDAVLDGLRGCAAIAVLGFHLGHWFGIQGLARNAWLAVDFFFCLSGYVLAMVYQGRLDAGWRLWRFMKLRLIRLMPLTILGTIISAAYVALRIATKHEHAGQESLALATVVGLADLPYLYAPKAIGGPQVFPLNGPQYSLFLEIVVNAFWALAIVLRGRTASVILTIVGLLGIIIFGLGGDDTATFWNGLPRVFCSFYLGTLTYHAGPWIRAKAGGLFPLGLAAMAALFLWPYPLPFAVVILWIVIGSPLLVASAAGVHLPNRLHPGALLLGRLSYPIYVLHFPLFCWINGAIQMRTHKQVPAIEIPLILVAVPLFSWLLLVSYDEPLRAVLARLSKARSTSAAVSQPELVATA